MLLYWYALSPQCIYARLRLHSMKLSTGCLSYSLCHHTPIKLLNCHGDWSLTVGSIYCTSAKPTYPPHRKVDTVGNLETRPHPNSHPIFFFPHEHWPLAECLVWSGLINQLMWCGRDGGGSLSNKLCFFNKIKGVCSIPDCMWLISYEKKMRQKVFHLMTFDRKTVIHFSNSIN